MSRVLNAPASVNREARLRVEASVRDLGCTRNGAARALRSRRSQTAGVILPTSRQPICAEVIGTFQDGMARHAAASMRALLAGRSHPARVEILPRLVVRDTTAPPHPLADVPGRPGTSAFAQGRRREVS